MDEQDHPLFCPLGTLLGIGNANAVFESGNRCVVRFHDDDICRFKKH